MSQITVSSFSKRGIPSFIKTGDDSLEAVRSSPRNWEIKLNSEEGRFLSRRKTRCRVHDGQQLRKWNAIDPIPLFSTLVEMDANNQLLNLSVSQLRKAADLKERIDLLNAELNSLLINGRFQERREGRGKSSGPYLPPSLPITALVSPSGSGNFPGSHLACPVDGSIPP